MKKIVIITALSAFISIGVLNASSGTPTISCCNATGNNIVLIGPCTCIAGSVGGRERGDIVTLNLAGSTAKTLPTTTGTAGKISVPNAGEMDLYQFGEIRIVFASFYLQNKDLNPKVSEDLEKIINAAAKNNPWAKTMVWVARALPKEPAFTEIQETYIGLDDLSKATPISYQVINSKTIAFTIPASKNAGEQVITADFSPINK